ncbi:NAD(P)-binding domain-containing protein [Chloroflexi bacterium TSY]|nr:NAD(P)-binding domain-containing protein [Chloroflexi bacterium TSY]
MKLKQDIYTEIEQIMSHNKPTIGFIGLGDMGGHMSRNLMKAGYPLIGYDLNEERLAAAVSAGAVQGTSIEHVVVQSDVIATSLPSSETFVQVSEQELLPNAHSNQIVIDFGTVTPSETRRLASRFADQHIDLLDVPVSGGPRGAEHAQLYMFVGGKQETVVRCRPILEAVGGPDRITYCGPAGCGQVVKGVNQLMMGLVDAAYLEAISFGVNEGIDINVIQQAIGTGGRWRSNFNHTAQRIADGNGMNVGVKFRELPYFLRSAEETGFELPMTRVLRDYCEKGERITIDDHREAPSYWHELTKGSFSAQTTP